MEPVTKDYLFETLTALVVTFTLLLGLNAIHTHRCHEKEMKILNEINAKIDQRNELDEAYRTHLEKCSFLDRESIYVTKSGYVKSHYNRGYAASQK